MLITWILLATGLTLRIGEAFPEFKFRIPNGPNIPNPCKPGETWFGVGHLNYLGAGPLNAFGLAFKKAGFRWTEELCKADSDGDGRTNGFELGDPNCTWKEGQQPPEIIAIEKLSHPGFCDDPTKTCLEGTKKELFCATS